MAMSLRRQIRLQLKFPSINCERLAYNLSTINSDIQEGRLLFREVIVLVVYDKSSYQYVSNSEWLPKVNLFESTN